MKIFDVDSIHKLTCQCLTEQNSEYTCLWKTIRTIVDYAIGGEFKTYIPERLPDSVVENLRNMGFYVVLVETPVPITCIGWEL